ncbi:MAG: hypothetical protein ABIT38_12770 [Gemmatimonadaceae bacterium]
MATRLMLHQNASAGAQVLRQGAGWDVVDHDGRDVRAPDGVERRENVNLWHVAQRA